MPKLKRLKYRISKFLGDEDVNGYGIDALWATRRCDGGQWSLDHRPSGRHAGSYRTATDAVVAAKAITRKYGAKSLQRTGRDFALEGLRGVIDRALERSRLVRR